MLDPAFLIVRGVVAIVVGVLSFLWPGLTIAILVAIFAVYAVVDGISNLFLGLTRSPRHERSWPFIVEGAIGMAAGVLTFIWPGITTLALVFLMGAWAVVTGGFEIAAAFRLRRTIAGEWLLLLSGVISIIFGLLVFAFPGAGAIGIAWILGAYAAVAGVVLISLGIRLRAQAMLAA